MDKDTRQAESTKWGTNGRVCNIHVRKKKKQQKAGERYKSCSSIPNFQANYEKVPLNT